MEVVIVDTRAQGASLVADAIGALLSATRPPVLGLATGSSPAPVYRELAHRRAAGRLDLSAASAFLLDEYLGLAPDHPAAYRRVIEEQVVAPLAMDSARVHGLDGTTADPPATCAAYEAQIAAAGGVDLQLLGIGTDGHIGFNEPGSSLASRTRIKTLTDQTRHDNARFFADDVEAVPRHVLTQGVGTILQAHHLVLVAWGADKAAAVAAACEGPITVSVPATALQLHPHATVVVDRRAAAQLSRRDYDAAVFALKPSWQGL